jgi:hypothetical protein
VIQELRQGLGSDEYAVSYGRRLTNAWAVGAAIRMTDAQIDHEFSSPELGGQPLRAITRFVAPDVNFGIADRMTNTVTLGAVITVSRARPETELQTIDALLVPSGLSATQVVLPPRTLLSTSKDRFWYYALGFGLGYKPRPDLDVYVDVRAARSTAAVAGTIDLGRMATGVEHHVNDRWSWRAGISVNTQRDVTPSFGLGYRFRRDLDFTVAWQANGSPEVNRELGCTRLIAASLGWRL